MFHAKRHHSPPPSSSSDVSDSETTPTHHRQRKRRFISSDEDNSAMSSPHRLSLSMKKRRHEDDVYSEDDVDQDRHDPSLSSTSLSTTPTPRQFHAVPPATKRLRRGLSDGFNKLGLREGEHQRLPTPFGTGSPQGSDSREDGEIQPSSIFVPGEGEIGPAVWVRHASPSKDDEQDDPDRGVKYVIIGEDGEEEELSGKEVGIWRGRPTPTVDAQGNTIYVPSYLQNNVSSPKRHLPPPNDAWRNQERGLILYTPQPPPTYGPSAPPASLIDIDSSNTSSNPTSPSISPMDTSASTPTGDFPPSGYELWPFGQNGGGTISEVPLRATSAGNMADSGQYVEAVEESGGGMDLD